MMLLLCTHQEVQAIQKGVLLTHRGIIFAPFLLDNYYNMGRLAETNNDESTDSESENNYQMQLY